MSILDPAPRQVSPNKAPLVDQYWRIEAAATRAIDGGLGGSKDQKIRSQRRLGRDRRSTTLPKSILHI